MTPMLLEDREGTRVSGASGNIPCLRTEAHSQVERLTGDARSPQPATPHPWPRTAGLTLSSALASTWPPAGPGSLSLSRPLWEHPESPAGHLWPPLPTDLKSSHWPGWGGLLGLGVWDGKGKLLKWGQPDVSLHHTRPRQARHMSTGRFQRPREPPWSPLSRGLAWPRAAVCPSTTRRDAMPTS